MTEPLLASLSMDNPSTSLTIDTFQGLGSGQHDEQDPFRQGHDPVDINLLPLSMEPASWHDHSSSFTQIHTLDVNLSQPLQPPKSLPTAGGKAKRREDLIWGAWFFFSYYFRPCLSEKAQGKLGRSGQLLAPAEPGDIQLEPFLVQHDMENCYMWAMRRKPHNALGKMQLRSFINGGHARAGEPSFPFGAERGFPRSHRMQRRHYRGLANPQCLHGVQLVRSPSLSAASEGDRQRWAELTGREPDFSLPEEAEQYTDWRNSPGNDGEPEDDNMPDLSSRSLTERLKKKKRSPVGGPGKGQKLPTLSLSKEAGNGAGGVVFGGTPKRPRKGRGGDAELASIGVVGFNGTLGLGQEYCGGGELLMEDAPASAQLLTLQEQPIIQQPKWVGDFSGSMSLARGPVTAAKSIYEDDRGYLVLVSLPFVDLQTLRVTWRNDDNQGVVKIHCRNATQLPFLNRWDRTFKLTDAHPELPPPGDFFREIRLPTRIPDDADVRAFVGESGSGVEILVPKHPVFSKEREVRLYLHASHSSTGHDSLLS